MTAPGRTSGAEVHLGKTLGVFRIDALIGAGGMGEVYRAHDTRLERDVAIKILGAGFAGDAEQLARLKREARILAALKHPRIATIHGIEESGDTCALVLELIDGKTLAERLAQGALPIALAVDVAKQLVEGLDAAHEKGIVHRDLKPANVAMLPDGGIKILDFGIAKTMSAGKGALTEVGTVIGTAAYMSPEQARGVEVDRRTDVWAFGCVCFEMLTGQPPFAGATFSDTLVAVLEREPDWSLLPAATPATLRRLLRRCLEKDPKRRLRDIADARIDLEEPLASTSMPRAARGRGREYGGWVAATLLAFALVYTFSYQNGRDAVPAAISRTTIHLPPGERLASNDGSYPLALSANGSRLAFVSDVGGASQLLLREIGELEAKVMPGTAGAGHPFFSADGAWVGFFATGVLQKIAVAGGPPVRICAVEGEVRGATWSADGTIAWAGRDGKLMKVDADGGTPQELYTGPAAWPQFLPDGKTLLFTYRAQAFGLLSSEGGSPRIIARVSSSDADAPAVLGTGGGLAQAQYVSSGHIVFGQSPGIVRAMPFDTGSGEVTGTVVSLLDSLERGRNGGAVYFAVAADGTLVYATTGSKHRLVWVDRSGVETPIIAETADYRGPRLSSDGKRLLVMANDETRRSDIWLVDVARGTRTRLTSERHNLGATWAPGDGRFAMSSGGEVVEVELGRNATPVVLLPADVIRQRVAVGEMLYPKDWSPDGKVLVLTEGEENTWVFAPNSGELTPLFASASFENDPAFSADGQWLAFTSNESGRLEVYVVDFPSLAQQTVVSVGGGEAPVWSRDGRELFYRRGDDVMAASIDTSDGVRVGQPKRLFGGPYFGAGREATFDVTPDGQRFAMIRSDETAQLQRVTVVQNWSEDLRARVPSR